MYRATFTRVFSAAHRVWNDPGKCHNIHGHNYRCEVDVQTDELNEQGFVLPFDAIKQAVDQYDHALIVDEADPLLRDIVNLGLVVVAVPGVPSTEFMAQQIADDIRSMVRIDSRTRTHGNATVHVSLRETDGILAYGFAS